MIFKRAFGVNFMDGSFGANGHNISEPQVDSDFVSASVPKTDFAKDLLLQVSTIEAAGNSANLKISGSNRSLVHRVNPYLLKIKPDWNCRDHKNPKNIEHVRQLARSIAARGVSQPITVSIENGGLYITDGHCRYLAVMHAINELRAEIQTVPILEEPKYSSEADRVSSQVVRNGGKPLGPLENGRVFHRLLRLGWTEQTIAEAAGISAKQVANLIELHSQSTEEMKRLISEEKISATFASQILKKAGSPAAAEKQVLRVLKAAEDRGLTRASPKHLIDIEDAEEGAGTNTGMSSAQSQGAATKVKVRAARIIAPDIKNLEALIMSQAIFEVVDGFVSVRMPKRKFAKLRSMAKMLKATGALA
jgi:ParB/RepB/Spo0J family partition protein